MKTAGSIGPDPDTIERQRHALLRTTSSSQPQLLPSQRHAYFENGSNVKMAPMSQPLRARAADGGAVRQTPPAMLWGVDQRQGVVKLRSSCVDTARSSSHSQPQLMSTAAAVDDPDAIASQRHAVRKPLPARSVVTAATVDDPNGSNTQTMAPTSAESGNPDAIDGHLHASPHAQSSPQPQLLPASRGTTVSPLRRRRQVSSESCLTAHIFGGHPSEPELRWGMD